MGILEHVPEDPGDRGPFRQGGIDGKRNFGNSPLGATLRQYALPTGMLGILAERAGVTLPPPEPPFIFEDEVGVFAELNADRWVVRCPVVGCGGASFIWLDTPLFMCADCFNSATDGLWRKVNIPDEEERAEIEEITGYRMLPSARNWNADETVADLVEQNKERGERVPQRYRGGRSPHPVEEQEG